MEARNEWWFDLWNGNEGSGGKKRVSLYAPLSIGKFGSQLFNATHPFLAPKEQQARYSKKKASKSGFRCFFFASLRFVSKSLQRQPSIAPYFFPIFFDLQSRKVIEIFGQ